MHGIPHCARNDKKERSERHRACHAERSEASILDSSLSLGMTKKSARNDTTLVMLNGAKHPCTGFLTALGMTKKSARNDTTLVMLSEAKHPCTGFLTALGMTKGNARERQKKSIRHDKTLLAMIFSHLFTNAFRSMRFLNSTASM